MTEEDKKEIICFTHFYVPDTRLPVKKDGSTANRPVATRCVIWHDTTPVAVGYAICSKNDNFSREKGRKISKIRAEQALKLKSSLGWLRGSNSAQVLWEARHSFFSTNREDFCLQAVIKGVIIPKGIYIEDPQLIEDLPEEVCEFLKAGAGSMPFKPTK